MHRRRVRRPQRHVVDRANDLGLPLALLGDLLLHLVFDLHDVLGAETSAERAAWPDAMAASTRAA